MGIDDLERRFAALEHRLTRLEALLGATAIPQSEPLQPIQAIPSGQLERLPSPAIAAAAATHPTIAIPHPVAAVASSSQVDEITLDLDADPSSTEATGPLDYEVRAPHVQSPAKARSGLEQAIGLKWTGWIGAIVFVIGGAMAVKFAYEQGWWQQEPPAVRLTMMLLGGVALLGAGEWVFRRINVVAAASLFGAGTAVFFLVSYAGNAYYGLYSANAAFILMGLSTLVGAAVAIRGDLLSIAVLSLVGGNIAPLVLQTEHARIPPFLAYLLMLQLVALCLAFRGTRGKWWTLRGLSLATTTLWLAAILSAPRSQHDRPLILGFVVLFAFLYHAELILSARRNTRVHANYLSFFSMFVTAGSVAALLTIEQSAGSIVRGACVLGTCAAIFLTGTLLRRSKVDVRARVMSLSYYLQAAALLVVAVPVVCRGVGIELGWAILGLTFSIFGRAAGLRAARFYALACWLLSLIAVYLVAASNALDMGLRLRESTIWLHLAGAELHDYTIIAWILALFGHAIAAFNADHEGESTRERSMTKSATWMHGTTIVADAVWVIAAVAALEPLGATFALMVFAWLLAAMDFFNRRPVWVAHSMVLLIIALVKWAFVDMLTGFWSAPSSALWASRFMPVFNPLMGMGLILSISIAAEWWFLRPRFAVVLTWTSFDQLEERRSVLGCAALLICVITFALSFEIVRIVQLALLRGNPLIWPPDQLTQLGWTLLWTGASCALMGLSLRVAISGQRANWLSILACLPLVLGTKFLLIDTLFFRVLHNSAPAMVIANLQTLAAVGVTGGLTFTWFVGRDKRHVGTMGRPLQFVSTLIGAAVLLWCGTLEIDRACDHVPRIVRMGASAQLAKQVAWSIYWALFALGSIAIGFSLRNLAIRYIGLFLFGLTLLKVFLVDLSQVGRGYRIVSFMALGVLLLGTSVLYGKLTPRLPTKASEAA